MTSEIESLKTNEFLRRRKLRLQQVREQSKDIAKKLRQRANVEKLRQTSDLDAKKQKEYFDKQEKLVKRLEVLYAKGLENVGASHRSASDVRQEVCADTIAKVDISKVRAKEAATELKRKKQQKLDEQKKLLDRKLQAREAANELSREKSSILANKLLTKASTSNENTQNKVQSVPDQVAQENAEPGTSDPRAVTTTDMATQWDFDGQPTEWDPTVPSLSLPKDDRDSIKESENNIIDSKSSKRLDLFALSKEMPSSLRGGNINIPDERIPVKPSMTLVSEYLQSRGLRLRESETTSSTKMPSEDLHSIKQTIQRTRASRAEGSSVCHVLDGQVIPVPTWQQADQPGSNNKYKHIVKSRQFNSVTNSEINKIFSSIRPAPQELHPSPTLRGSSPFRRSKVCQKTFSGKASNIEKSRSTSQDSNLNRKNSVTMYNHSTRNTRDVPCRDNKLVVRDRQTEEDAYAQAMRETNADMMHDKEHHKKIQDMRNKVAMTKQNVEKEYKDTMNFLNSIPKDKCSKGVRNSYMDDRRHQMVKENRQLKLQQEYNKIEKECKRQHHCNKSRSKSKSPTKVNMGIVNDFESRDFQYSWMPVPESDGNLAIHTIPTATREGKSSNTVKFSKVDSYHEYRSRHKHTPPTKDTASIEKPRKKVIEAAINDKSSTESIDSSSISSETSSVEDLGLDTRDKGRKNNHKQPDQNMSDAERIIIYKILDSRSDKKSNKNSHIVNDVAKSFTSTEKGRKSSEYDNIELARKHKSKIISKDTENRVSFEQLNEGVYKMVNDKGNNVTSMYFTDNQQQNENIVRISDELNYVESCSCKKPNKEQRDRGNTLSWECGDEQPVRIPNVATQSTHTKPAETPATQPSATTSSASFKTVINDKPNILSEDGFIKLVDDAGQEAGKFYIGATGFFKDDDYEMVIQLKKKGGKEENVVRDAEVKVVNKTKEVEVVQLATDVNDVHKANEEVRYILAETRPSETLSKRSSPPTICEIVPETNIRATQSTTEQEPHINVNTCENNGDVDNAKPAVSKSKLVDKGVGTSFQLSYAIPTHVPKDDRVSRPATSTCTQTTLSSPNHRPVLLHMSSSTSTAYMSPPEMVLPKFLRHEFHSPDDKMVYEPVQRVEITQRQDTCQKYPNCTCKRCTRIRKTTMKVNGPSCYRSEYESKIIYTPPNTARSCSSRHRHGLPTHKHRVDPSPIPSMAKCKCKKCESGIHSKNCVKTDLQTCKRNVGGYKRTNGNINTRINSGNAPRTKQIMTRSHNSKINPVIKDYVNRLLDLNKEGLKVIEVVDQECSSVATPGSSIINVPCNVDERKGPLEKKISLEQIKDILKKQLFEEHIQKIKNKAKDVSVCTRNSTNKILKPVTRRPRLKPVHKVKSLNISKHILKTKNSEEVKKVVNKPVSTSTTDDTGNILRKSIPKNTNCRSKSSPTPRQACASKSTSRCTDSDITTAKKSNTEQSNFRRLNKDNKIAPNVLNTQPGVQHHINSNNIFRSHRATITSTSPDSESTGVSQNYKTEIPISMSTQTSQNVDSEASFMKLAEDKLHNMEKIADLTEKCTQRLSNLAKVLEEVRKNKSLAYSAISTTDSTSDSDQKSDKVVTPILSDLSDNGYIKLPEIKPHKQEIGTETEKAKDVQFEFTPLLTDIPKPAALIVPSSNILQSSKSVEALPLDLNITPETVPKGRPKPPPALSRIHLKNGQEPVIPHELSTVLEVDSPMSVKHKSQSSRIEIKFDVPDNASSRATNHIEQNQVAEVLNNDQRSQETNVNPDLLQSNMEFDKQKQCKSSSTETSDDPKFQMIDLKHFNDIMLEPFISIHDYAKQYNVEPLDEGSNMEEVNKDVNNDDASSLHSDGSLPDVIAELLKRNIISEPFKFDTASNINSTTISSESTMSVLALSKVRKDKKKSSGMFKNKENIAETSDSLSISSNPDLENAFKKLGMGWASSTLKKTKERLALSSSSNTSSSSVSQFKMKSFNSDIPALVTDSVSSVLNLSKKVARGAPNESSNRNAEQQTSLINSMTVKEFLTNELAKKITFTNKSNRNDTEEEFVSLFETKMPEEMKDDPSLSMQSGGNNRARTSTPVQIFKSMTYHSSSSSNISNGLFSNADDLSSVKMTSNSMKNHSTSDKDDLTVPNFSLRLKKSSDCSKSD